MTSQTSRVLFVGAMLLSSVSAASANTRTSLESFTSALSVDAFVEYIRAMPWDTNSVLRDVQTLVLTAAIVDFAAFTGVFLTDLSRAMETKRGIQKVRGERGPACRLFAYCQSRSCCVCASADA
nr:hypothetical protein HK105_005539 [Polyrhizophydium stewartii]